MAKLRGELGWTQAQLAARVAVSRVALSHVESNVSIPSERTVTLIGKPDCHLCERTVTLLAGVFGRDPHELAAGTDYPPAKAERLPLVAARHTEVDHQLAVLEAVLGLVERVPGPGRDRLAADLRHEWRDRLGDLLARTADLDERRRLRSALRALATDP